MNIKQNIKRLKNWTISLGTRRTASYWLGFIVFIESSFFPVPGDVLYIPMSLLRPKKAYHYAFIATVCSILGGILGWYIGAYAYDSIARPVLEFYDKYDYFQALQTHITQEMLVVCIFLSGLFHIPPIKMTTLFAGAMDIPLWLFATTSLIARGARFYFFAWLIQRFGSQVLSFISKQWKWVLFTGLIAFGLIYGLFSTVLKYYLNF
ncbi:hypothetical protein X471_00791 [Bartonella bacilliformis str. Heidi Mejia]|uniref:DedA family protein n=2 Tax=Bartonella bacilliformis TaxID=774 RepID=A0ABN0IHS8_BARBA|nr:YqaA family protein [Bartonella bacilliformis]ABM45558.1 putative membrane protein [Bartonella bacilliformis KC583]AMG85397.1 DedA family protein [Bartonella bacilliformis]EKS46072.1 hypothetical protein BbINS_00880 [Bartonella bacilliformis INS]EYS89166.1 hypothetical protein X472_00785 [Bartonella bacilliformis San Pedro600-02]EYS91349.1 hypothetical protein X471_00791 [Bartonella bacilliformis str. Heidi Mejia]